MQAIRPSHIATAILCTLLIGCNSSTPNNGALASGGNTELPALGTPIVNPGIGGTVTRLSDSAAGTASSAGYITKTDYSRVQAENADGSQLLVLASNNDGLLQYALLPATGGTAKTITFDDNVSGLSFMHDETEARWHPTDPNRIRFIQGQNSYLGSLKVFEYNTSDNSVSLLADLSGKLPAHWGNLLYGFTGYEGSFSQDGNRLAWIIETGENNSEVPVGYVAFDIRNGGQVLGTLDYDNRNHDHLSIAPSGEYVVISASQKTTVHPVDFSSERTLLNETQHSDLCLTEDGQDCYVSASFNDRGNANYGWVFMTELASGQTTPLFNVFGSGNTSLHLSGRALDRPGWALMSTYNCSSSQSTAKCNRLSLIELKANPQIIDLTATHSSGKNYYAEPHATISRDGTRAYFNSDWDNAGSINVFRLEIPESLYE